MSWLDFGAHLAPFDLPLGPLGPPWAPFEVHGGYMGSLWGPMGLPLGSLGVPWGALGCPGQFSQICRNLEAQFRANVSICTRLRIESSLPEFARPARGARGAGGARGNGVTESCSDPPSHTRRGLDKGPWTGFGMCWLDFGFLRPALGPLGASMGSL